MKRYFIALVTVVLFLLGLYTISKSKQKPYKYDVKKDYCYNFNLTGDSLLVNYDESDSIVLPKITGSKTAFLKVNITSTFLGKLKQPFIKISSKGVESIHYFEYGAKGVRYLNVSDFVNEQKIKLESSYLNFSSLPTQLIVFKEPQLKGKRVMVISPHPDDAEIAAFGLYSSQNETTIVTITAGDGGEFTYDEVYNDSVRHYIQKGRLRTWNSITVPLLANVDYENSINLGFFDSTLHTMYKNKSNSVRSPFAKHSNVDTYRKINISSLKDSLVGTANWNDLVRNLSFLLKKFSPDIIVTPYPAIDLHKDHQYSTVAIIEALKSLHIRKGKLFLYTNHDIYSEMYPYGKAGSIVTLPPNFDKNFYFDGIFSYSLSEEKQKQKLFALEAMNDLRLDTEWRDNSNFFKKAINQSLRGFLGIDYSYFRRSVRPNELFFIVDVNSVYNDTRYNRIVNTP